MADIADRASEYEERFLAESLARRANIARNSGVIYADCQECGEPIPERRQAPGVDLCVDCQTLREAGAL